ncbi:hypothetical protein Cgig2_020531 [Carnegiea gigantea]|uniref:Coiled-coil domain-containing protein 72 homolog n=1 Tax=Carnegiea gigantea TaxID=171969 RepID=A0A9Q1KBW8_9CARY|nr:hypothetical protein Cgig2_020531 [Carnegiea gigantea]
MGAAVPRASQCEQAEITEGLAIRFALRKAKRCNAQYFVIGSNRLCLISKLQNRRRGKAGGKAKPLKQPKKETKEYDEVDLANLQKKKEEEKALKELKAKAQQKGQFGGTGLKKTAEGNEYVTLNVMFTVVVDGDEIWTLHPTKFSEKVNAIAASSLMKVMDAINVGMEYSRER